MKEAYLYEPLNDSKVACHLCSHGCIITDGSTGICNVRKNISGKLFSLVYNKIIARHLDPIEKKPLFHFLPGSSSYSIATAGCNLKCLFCQNSEISQMPVNSSRILGENISPEEIVADVLAARASTIAYTYTEPTIYFETALDTARIASEKGIKNIFVSNGYMTEKCIKEIGPDLHGANVDLKAFTDKFYKEQCGARLNPVLRSIETMRKMGVWVEVTTLLIPGLNDSDGELRDIAQFLKSVDADIPWHISRFHPTYRLTHIAATPPERLRKAREIGIEEGLKYVYTGNLPGDEGEKTFCHHCGELIIDRSGFSIVHNRVKGSNCPDCGIEIPGVFK